MRKYLISLALIGTSATALPVNNCNRSINQYGHPFNCSCPSGGLYNPSSGTCEETNTANTTRPHYSSLPTPSSGSSNSPQTSTQLPAGKPNTDPSLVRNFYCSDGVKYVVLMGKGCTDSREGTCPFNGFCSNKAVASTGMAPTEEVEACQKEDSPALQKCLKEYTKSNPEHPKVHKQGSLNKPMDNYIVGTAGAIINEKCLPVASTCKSSRSQLIDSGDLDCLRELKYPMAKDCIFAIKRNGQDYARSQAASGSPASISNSAK